MRPGWSNGEALGAVAREMLVWMHSPDHPQWSIPAGSIDRIRSVLGSAWHVRELRVPLQASGDGPRRSPPELLAAIPSAEVYLGFGIPRDAFLAGRSLRWVHSGAAGVAWFPELHDSDVWLTNSAGVYAEPLAEHGLAMILWFTRGLDVATAGKVARTWTHRPLTAAQGPVRELAGLTVGIVGYGGIGSALGRRAAALGMRVVAIRRHPATPPPEVEALWGPQNLDELLAAADIVVLTVPETSATRGLIGSRELACMRPGSVLINLARGGLVTERALIESLRKGHLRGAALDVFATEPLPAASPLWSMESVLITPHVGGTSPRFWERETALIERNLVHYLAGEPLENLVDRQEGY